MIIVTGAAGFIGSCLVGALNDLGHKDLVLVDDFSRTNKRLNWINQSYRYRIERDFFIEKWLSENANDVNFIFHLGARTDTSETKVEIFDRLNLGYSKKVWELCAKHQIPLVYASSAATYGDGSWGYTDRHELIPQLKPLNPYGDSKQDFDRWVLDRIDAGDVVPPFWAGLKFFNVYGPNEYHKGRMASVVFHCFNQVKSTGAMKLFRSHRADYEDGMQSRDFVYVKDVVRVCAWLMSEQPASGIYNLGSGKARTFLDLVEATFTALDVPTNVSFIDTPTDIRATYQYFTEANMSKLRAAGYSADFIPLEDGVSDYVKSYLTTLNR